MGDVLRSKNVLTVYDLRNPQVVSNLALEINAALVDGHKSINFSLEHVSTAYPNTLVPLSALASALEAGGVSVVFAGQNEFLERSRVANPIEATEENLNSASSALSVVWKFESGEQIFPLVMRLVSEFEQRLRFASGALYGLHWALTEALDNILNHSGLTEGLIMAVAHPQSAPPRAVVCVADVGQGIFSSLSSSLPIPTSRDALTMALEKGVTRDRELGQGNGLWGLSRFVLELGGRLVLRSGESLVEVTRAGAKFSDQVFLHGHPGVVLDFQMETSHSIDPQEVLEMAFPPVNFRLEERESEVGLHRLSVADLKLGTGTRFAGKKTRTVALNMLSAGASQLMIDFEGIAVVSSSFADEFIGKLVVELGFVTFTNAIQIVGADQFAHATIQKAVAERLSESLNGRNGH